MPSAALNILKCVLKQNNYNSEIIYWNVKFEKIFGELAVFSDDENYELERILPFTHFQSLKHSDVNAQRRVIEILKANYKVSDKIKKPLQAENITQMLNNFNISFNRLVKEEFSGTDYSNVIISGFSSKFYQWLAALPIAELTKKTYPWIKTVIGGFDSKGSAEEILRVFDCFDFAVWGEGEYCMLELAEAITNQKYNFNDISGLVFRENKKIKVSENKTRKFFDLNSYPVTDYDDFFSVAKEDKNKGQFLFYPIESNRGCSWNKCRFCVLGNGYKYRERDIKGITCEIAKAIEKYHCGYFQFLDNNVAGSKAYRFEDLLDELGELFIKSNNDFCLFGEIIPFGYDAAFYKKLAIAGFRMIQIGGESFSDSLIIKMNKKNAFSDNLLGYKFCLKYGIQVEGANIITGIPGETEDDIQECIENIPFLRFYTGSNLIRFGESPFALEKLSKFYREMIPEEKENFKSNYIYNLLPVQLSENIKRFELFSFKRNKPLNRKLWDKFFTTLDSYYKTNFTYKIFRYNDVVLYEEFNERVKVSSIVFDEYEQWEILTIANNEICSFDELYKKLIKKYQGLTKAKLKSLMKQLRTRHLLYYNNNFDNIISIIDTELIN